MSLHRPSLSFAVIVVLISATILTALSVVSQQVLDYIFLCSVALALFKTFRKTALHPFVAGGIAVAIAGSLAGLQIWLPSLQYMPYLVIAPANVVMTYYFARGLFPGHQPVLLQLIRAVGKGPVDDPRFRRFVVSQCVLWSVMTFATACLASLAMVSQSAWPWVTGVLTNLIVIQIAWFVLSHYYASLRYDRPETWRNTLHAMTRPGVWSSLRA